MLCCVGLFAGAILGGAAGIPWLPYITMPLGGGVGLLADVMIFRTIDKKRKSEEQQKETGMNQMCCASIFNLKKKKAAVASET